MKVKQYIKTRNLFKTSNKKRNIHSEQDLVLIKKVEISTKKEYLQVFSDFIRTQATQISICHRLVYNEIPYSSQYIITKRCDACFISKTNEMIGLIECFVIYNNTVYVIAKRLVSLFNSFYTPLCPEIKSSMLFCYISDQLFIQEIRNIKKTVFVHISEENCFVSLFKSSHLFS